MAIDRLAEADEARRAMAEAYFGWIFNDRK
jgi:hypothetical protein